VAGPLFDNGGDTPVGSLYRLHTRSLARAREIIGNDPYVKHGAFASVRVLPRMCRPAGRYIGGKIW
jgi:uncharacterized protein YciI